MGSLPQQLAPLASSRFEVVRTLGHGGMGVVYEAIDRERGERVALKTLLHMDADGLLRFKQEFRALQGLHHPNLVSLGELIEESGQWFFTMELLEGVDFVSYVRGGGGDASPSPRAQAASADDPTAVSDRAASDPTATSDPASDPTAVGSNDAGMKPMPPSTSSAPIRVRRAGRVDEVRLRAALAQLVAGIQVLHHAGKVHRDIKPSNVMVTSSGRVVLLDFGLIADADPRGPSDRAVVGTAAYMAPEQATGRPPERAADWYSVGTILFEALTGCLPFDGGSAIDVLIRKTREDAPRASALARAVPADLDALCVALLQRETSERPLGAEIRAKVGARVDSERSIPVATLGAAPFIGRAAERKALRAAFAEATAGKPLVLLVCGESGVGKSALVRHFLDEIGGGPAPARVFAGRCYERESVPYKAFDGIIDEVSQFLLYEADARRYLPEHAALMAQLFPVLNRVPAIANAARADAVDPHEQRLRAFAAVGDLLERVARRHPLVVSIDDLQWADADSLALLAEALRAPRMPPLLLVGTVREGGRHSEWLDVDHLAAQLPVEVRQLRVTSLPAEDAVALASTLLRELAPAAAADAATIARETAGHPMYISELVRHARRAGKGGHLLLDEALWRRVCGFDGPVRDLVEIVATGGVPTPQAVVARALGVELPELARRLAPLRAGNLLRSTGPRAEDLVEVYHDRVREAVAEHLSAERLRQLHRHLAVALEAGAADAERIAQHWHGAGEAVLAAAAYLHAAHKAEEALAFERAAHLYQHALDLSLPPEVQPLDVKARLGDALANAGRGRDSATAYLAAAELAPPDRAVDLKVRAAEELLRCGHVDEGLEVMSSALDVLGIRIRSTPKRALMSLLLTRARVRLRGLKFKERPASEVPPADLRRIDACWSIALSFGHVDPIRGADVQARHLLLALEAGEPYRVARSLAAEAGFAATDGASGRARTAMLVAATEALATRVGHPHGLGICEMARGLAAYFVGEWRPALQGCQRAEAIYRDRCVGVMRELVTAELFTLWSLAYLGELAEMSRRLDVYLREAAARSDLYAGTSMRHGLMNLAWLRTGDVERAREELRIAMGPWSHEGGMQHMDNLIAVGNIDLYAGEAEAARARIVAAWPALVRALLLTVQVSRVEMRQLRARCTLAAVVADPRRADAKKLLRATESDGKRLTAEKLPWTVALGSLVQAGAQAARGELETAAATLETAIAACDRAEMGLYAAAARRRRGQLIGGSAGAALIADADAHLAAQGVRDPARMTTVFAPGFDRP